VCSALPIRRVLILITIVAACLYGSISGREDFMNKLPVVEGGRCAICHRSSEPTTTDNTLNKFGEDFRDNGNVWNGTLAEMDSDEDGYNNGIELNDPEGDGNSTATSIRSNPGDIHDKPSSIDQKTWGVIKQLFADK